MTDDPRWRTLVPTDTHAQRMRAIEAFPETVRRAAEEGPGMYWMAAWETAVGLGTYFSCPWLWFYPPPPHPLDW